VLYLSECFLFIVAFKWGLADQENVQYDSSTPYITPVIEESINDFRSHIAGGSNETCT
jgi:hypothetical protein